MEKIDFRSVCEVLNWTASIDTNGGTPGKRNSVNFAGSNTIPFQADSVKLISDTTITVYFNKSLDISTLVAENFKLNPSNIQKKLTSDPLVKEVLLNFAKKFQPGTEYQISISNVKDCSGNSIINDQQLRFKTTQLPPPILERIDTARILISEIFADPSPEIGLPLVEFIELYNPGSQPVDLDKWVISDASTKSIITNTIISPGEYLILCPLADTLSFKQYGKTKGISPWPSLGNADDQIILKSFKQRVVDSVPYSDKWYKDRIKKNGGWSLEKADLLNNSCNGFYTWGSSTNASGGTPGQINSLNTTVSYQQPMQIDSITYTSDSTLILSLNSIADTSKIRPRYFHIDNAIGQATVATMEDNYLNLRLKFTTKFHEGVQYILTADSLFNCAGKRTIPPNNQISFIIPEVPEIDYPIFINEILADPSPPLQLPETEFIELYNPTNNAVSLKGMFYGDETVHYQFNTGEIASKSYLILCPQKDSLKFTSFGKVLGLPMWPSLNNEKDVLILKNNKGKEFQRVSYTSSWYKDNEKKNGGYSLEMINPSSICTGIQNWGASINLTGGTPGKENSIYASGPIESLKLIEAIFTDSVTIQLTFNKTIDSLSASVTTNYRVNNGVGIPDSVKLFSPDFSQVRLKFRESPARGHTYRIEVFDVRDCAGSNISLSINSKDLFLAEKILKNAILINEVLFNPMPDGVDFVELYNNTKHTLDLQDLSIATIVKDTIASSKNISQKQLLFEPGNYIVITSNPETVKKQYIAKNPDKIIKGLLPQFNDDKGTVLLLNSNRIIDRLDYSDKMHFQLLKNFEGVSLERSSFQLSANEVGNFRSATATAGYATPGYRNSQYNEGPNSSEEFALQSRTFSPDNDGFEDMLQVSYRLDSPGMVANVKIFNDQGVLIKEIAKNLTLSIDGIFVWDGLNEFNHIANPGIYFIYAEIFDAKGTRKQFRKSFALAVKL